jgi:hypothetical protein
MKMIDCRKCKFDDIYAMYECFKVVGLGMGDNSIFSVFSNIWSSVRLKIPTQIQASWWQRLFTLDMAS